MTTINTLKAHLAINVNDVDASIDFYQRMLGIEPSKVRAGYAKFDVQNPPLNLTLNQVPFNGKGALSHLGIQVAGTEDVLAMRDQWTERGLIPRKLLRLPHQLPGISLAQVTVELLDHPGALVHGDLPHRVERCLHAPHRAHSAPQGGQAADQKGPHLSGQSLDRLGVKQRKQLGDVRENVVLV